MKRIVVIGPESTGKSTLCEELAAHYDTVYCPEYARHYLLENGMNYTFHDLSKIALGQLAVEDDLQADARNGVYFIDTDMNVMKVWYEVVFQHCPAWILKKIAQTKYDLYLLCNTDLPWVKDELREYPDLHIRKQLFKMYYDIVTNNSVPWAEVSGTAGQRLQKAVAAVDSILHHK